MEVLIVGSPTLDNFSSIGYPDYPELLKSSPEIRESDQKTIRLDVLAVALPSLTVPKKNLATLTLKDKLGSTHDVCGADTVAVPPPGKDAESWVLADGI